MSDTSAHRELDLSSARRLIVAGDVHGHLSLLTDALERIGYSSEDGDRLVLLGDLLDRGPDVESIIEWLDANPTVLHLLGNHDDMLAASVGVTPMDDHANPYNLMRNGGSWLCRFTGGRFDDGMDLMAALIEAEDDRGALVDPSIVAFARRLAASPVALTVRTPGGRRVGLVHGDVPAPSWQDLVAGLLNPDPFLARKAAKACMWERTRFDRAKMAMRFGEPDPADFVVRGIDHVFMGHSITKQPLVLGNCSWIDTGSYKHSLVTAVDVDDWLSGRP